MIDLTIDRARLLPLLTRAAQAAQSPLNSRQHVRLSRASVRAAGLEYDFQGTIADGDETGAVCVLAGELNARVQLMADGPVHVTCDDKHAVTLRSGKQRYTLRGAPAIDFPLMGEPTQPGTSLPAETLRRAIGRVAYAAAPKSDGMPERSTVLLEWEGKELRAVATDGHRLAVATEAVAAEWHGSILLPVGALRALTDKHDGDVAVGGDGWFQFSNGLTYRVNLVQARFPPYRTILQRSFLRQARFVRSALADAVRNVAVVGAKRVALAFTPGELTLTAESHDGDATDAIAVEYDGEPFTIALQPQYTIDALRSVDFEHVEVGLNGPLDPLTFLAEDWTALIMPVR